MKKSRFSEAKTMGILKQAEGGVPVPELCREHGMSNASFYKWRSKYGGMDASLISRMKAMDDENKRLKIGDGSENDPVNRFPVGTYAEAQMQNDVLKEALGIEAAAAPPVQAQGRTW